MSYKAPGIAVYQTIQPTAQTAIPEQDVALVGPSATLRLYNTTDAERAKSYIGSYTTGSNVAFDWLRDVGDTRVDLDFTKVYFRDALLTYNPSISVTVLKDVFNQVQLDTATLGTRGVKAGDVISLTINSQQYVSAIHTVEDIKTDTTVTDAAVTPATGAGGATITVSGTYTATAPTTYILDVIKGGAIADGAPIIRVRNIDGTDTTTDREVVADTAYPLGTRGLTFTITDGGSDSLTQGESFSYTVSVSAASTVKLLTLQQNLPKQASDLTNVPATLNVVRNLQVGATYFTQNQTGITINGDIKATDWEFGSALLPIVKAEVFVETRMWRTPTGSLVGEVGTLAELDELLPGVIHPANTLKYGIYKALQNMNNESVIFAIVTDPGLEDSWKSALNSLSKNLNAYAIVPLTDDEKFKQLVVQFVLDESTDEINRRKECWLSQSVNPITSVVTFSDEDPTLATVITNPSSVTGAAVINYVIADEGTFVESNVRPGDEFRIKYYTDLDGDLKYETRVVQRVINDVTLVLDEPFSAELTTPQRYEIWRPTTSANFEEQMGKINTWNHRRVIAVYPFNMSADGYSNIPGYFGAAAAAALTMAQDPNQASTLMVLRGIDAIEGYEELSEYNLNALATAGITLFAQDTNSGDIYLRHTVTTGNFDNINEREEMTTRNFDSVSNYYTASLMTLRGRITATTEGLTAVFSLLQVASDNLLKAYRTGGRSGQLVNYQIVSIGLDPVFQDVIVIRMNLELPHMANRIELHLQVVSTTSAAATVLSTGVVNLTTTAG